MKSPHVSSRPPRGGGSSTREQSLSRATSSPKTFRTGKLTRHFLYKINHSTLTKENLEVGKKWCVMSPYYNEVPFWKKFPGTILEAKSTTAIADDFKNLSGSSPYYKGLLYREKDVRDGTHVKAHDIRGLGMPSPYYKGLLFSSEEEVPAKKKVSVEKKVPAKFVCCYPAKQVPRKD